MTQTGSNVPAAIWRRQAADILSAWGLSADHAATTAGILTEADLMGIDSHGIAMLALYERQLQEGGANPRPDIRIVHDQAAVALIDADGGFGQVPSAMAAEMAGDRAEKFGIAAVAIRNSNHYGAAGIYARRLAERGLIGLSTSSVWRSAIVPTGGLEPRLGTNPIAFAAPCAGQRPFLLDMATSTAAIGKLKLAERADRPIPAGWALDRQGAPLLDPAKALRDTLLVPLGGHKGYGLATMVEILSSTLSGAAMTPLREAPAGHHDVGHFVMAIDPALIRGSREEFAAEMSRMVDALRATPARNRSVPVMVAGDPEYRCEDERRARGIALPHKLERQLRDICDRAGLVFRMAEEAVPG